MNEFVHPISICNAIMGGVNPYAIRTSGMLAVFRLLSLISVYIVGMYTSK